MLEQVNEIQQDEMKSRPYLNKKDKALTRKAQNALAFSKRFDEIMVKIDKLV